MLNNFIANISTLKIFILGTPKMGNTWIRWLFHYVYNIPVIEVPSEFDNDVFSKLPASFLTHQHLPPTMELCQWLVQNDVVVLTPMRHPGDTFISLFHFNKWSGDKSEADLVSMVDEDTLGENSFNHLTQSFPRSYALSLVWASLGAHVIKYENLLSAPLITLSQVTGKIYPVDDFVIKKAIYFSNPILLARGNKVDKRHFRSAKSGSWLNELPDEFIEEMRHLEPIATACKTYSYSWDKSIPPVAKFDYSEFNPFGRCAHFDNGQLVGTGLAGLHLLIKDAQLRWPRPEVTEGDSFWNWLKSPHPDANKNPQMPEMTLTNLMMLIRETRCDLRSAFPNPVGQDRIGFALWFIERVLFEYGVPWGLVAPVQDGVCDFFRRNISKKANVALMESHNIEFKW